MRAAPTCVPWVAATGAPAVVGSNLAARLIEHYKQMQEAFPGRIGQGPEAEVAQQGAEPGDQSLSPSVGHRTVGYRHNVLRAPVVTETSGRARELRAAEFVARGALLSHLALAETTWVLSAMYELTPAKIPTPSASDARLAHQQMGPELSANSNPDLQESL